MRIVHELADDPETTLQAAAMAILDKAWEEVNEALVRGEETPWWRWHDAVERCYRLIDEVRRVLIALRTEQEQKSQPKRRRNGR
jgi:hypothetical protein